jgi:hypothetical protein
MSSNLVAAWPQGIVCVSDRRLVDLPSGGKILTNRSTKLTVFGCRDARGVIVYNGIGMDDDRLTPSDWLLELASKEKLFDCGLSEVLERVRTDLENRLKVLCAKYGPKKARHTFVFAAWTHGVSVVYGISNYERVDEENQAAEGRLQVMLSESLPTPEAQVRIVASGVHPPRATVRAIASAIKTGPSNRVKALCMKAVRDAAYGKGKGRGTVGASCQWAALGPQRDQVWFGLDVVGGAIAREPPNLINIGAELTFGKSLSARIGNPGMLIKDMYAGDEKAEGVAEYDSISKTVAFSELKCGVCGTPLPASHQFCEICLYDKASR